MSHSKMQTAKSSVEGLGSAKSGTHHFFHQRLTSLANIGLTVFLVLFVLCAAGRPYAEVVVLVGNPVYATLLCLTLLSYGYHMKLGLQVVIEDYVTQPFIKMAALVLNLFVAIGLCLLGIVSVLTVSFGG